MSLQVETDVRDSLPKSPKGAWAIFWISVLSLFLEMLLIRWIGTEVRIFAYLQNTVLVACFLGLGIGYFTCRKPVHVSAVLVPLAVIVLLMAVPLVRIALGRTSELLSVLEDFVIWGNMSATSELKKLLFVGMGLALTYSVLIFIVDIFVPIGRALGRLIDDHPNTIWAYSVNIAGSLVGTWLFVIISFLNQPPFVWLIVFACLTLAFMIYFRPVKKLNLVLLGGMILAAWVSGLLTDSFEVVWSPYQKLEVTDPLETEAAGQTLINVNNTIYQVMVDLSDSFTLSNPAYFDPEQQGLSQYDLPVLLHPNPQSYLIVGAGSGNDAAGGVRQGVPHILAVEIDPAIISIGKRYHPEQPYASSTVQVVNDDARSFFATTQEKFDVISFSLLDSHTTTAMTNARLDHYVYTRESIARAKSLLNERGIMVLTFEAQKPYIADRMAKVLQETFGEEPLVFRIPATAYGWGGVMFIAGDLEVARNQIAQNQRLETYIGKLQEAYPMPLPLTTKIATDDWPYIYLQTPRIPVLYYLLAGLMALILVRSSRVWSAPKIFTRWQRTHWHFFFLGAAFLLLEVQNISKASVVLGNTWQTNAAIISGVLVMALLANLIAYRFPKVGSGVAYPALIGISILLYFVDLAQFAFLPYMVKVIVVGGLTTLPMIFSGIIFVRSFAAVQAKDEALGANILGSLVGALVQSVTFVIGIKALLLVVAGMYLASFFFRPLQQSETPG
ncbi:MAG: spermidine synthase [Chloroflexota bacterium]